MEKLSQYQKERYLRNILLPGIGSAGQKKLLESQVLVIGLGGLGSAVAYYLAAAGVGHLGIADHDTVDLSNLQRQILHTTQDVNNTKTDSAKEKLIALNPDLTITLYPQYLDVETINGIVSEFDFIVDATDNFSSKFLINDACHSERVPFSHGGIAEFSGQTMTVIPGESACYRCIFSDVPVGGAIPSPSELGVLGAVAGLLGTIQAAEVLKYITSSGTLLTNTLLTFDAGTMDFRKVPLRRQKNCTTCGG